MCGRRSDVSMIVELAGPAGVGKSTLNRALAGRLAAASGTIWGQPESSLLKNGVQSIPAFFPLWRLARAPLWQETTNMVRLRALLHSLRYLERNRAVIFDEGPVFALAWLRGFGHPVMRSLVADQWWQTAVRSWAGVIDAVVVLDAPDTLLAERIRARPNDHEVKRASDAEISIWMARFREALDWVLTELTREQGPIVVRLETSASTPEQIARQVLEAIDRGAYAG
jgi:broad-specificity NMP kinase